MTDASDLYPLGNPQDVERWVEDLYTEPELAPHIRRFNSEPIRRDIRDALAEQPLQRPGALTTLPSENPVSASNSSAPAVAPTPKKSVPSRKRGDLLRGLGVVGAIGFSAVGWWGLGQADIAERRANQMSAQRSQASDRALAAEEALALANTRVSQMQAGYSRMKNRLRLRAWERLDPGSPLAMGLVREIAATDDLPGLGAAAATAMHTPLQPQPLVLSRPAQKLVATADTKLIGLQDADQHLQIFAETQTGREAVATVPGTFSTQAIAASEDTIYAGSLDGTLYRTSGDRPEVFGRVEGAIHSVVYTSNGIISASIHGLLQRWSPTDEGTHLAQIPGVVHTVVSDPTGEHIVVHTRGGQTYVWDAGSELQQLQTPSAPLAVRICGQDAVPVVQLDNRVLTYRPAGADRLVVPLATDTKPIVAISCLDNHKLAVATEHEISLWDLNQPAQAYATIKLDTAIDSLRPHGAAGHIVVTATDGRLQVWDLLQKTRTLDVATGQQIAEVALSADTSHAMIRDRSGQIRSLNLDTHATVAAYTIDSPSQPEAVAFAPTEQMFAAAWPDAPIKVYDHTGGLVQTLPHSQANITALTFSDAGKYLLAGSLDHHLGLWDLTSDTPQPLILRGHQAAITAVSLDADGSLAATASKDGALRLWHTEDQSATILRTGGDPISAVKIAPDGQSLVSGDTRGVVTLWPIARALAAPQVLRQHSAKINAVAYHPHRDVFATASEDGTVRLWSRDNLEDPRVLQHTGPVRSLTFSQDGSELVTTVADASLWTWPTVASGQPTILRDIEAAGLATATVSPTGTIATIHPNSIRLWPRAPQAMLDTLWSLPVECPTIGERIRVLGDDHNSAGLDHQNCQARRQAR